MPVIYKTFQSVFEDKSGKKLFFPRVYLIGNVSTEQIAREIAAYSSLSTGDVKNTIDNLVTVMTQHLQSSESVTLDGFGTFRMTMKSAGKGVSTVKEVSAAQSTLKVRFTPASTRNPDHSVATRSMVTGVKCVPYKSGTTGSGSGNEGGGGNEGEGGLEEDPLG
ncbi:HU family DNA-binding protein [uncultured Bacteroides sp.]|uniref:HU family DNA-binding protein n=1 Tax=uncultured Bacteroides sp. TaxID=162156 RepID=UPI002600FEA2|nr:HU family DNA-binding protein [uncultured Bacteroides sp.]